MHQVTAITANPILASDRCLLTDSDRFNPTDQGSARWGRVIGVRDELLVEQDRRPVSQEAAAVQPNVEQPVRFVVRLFGRGIEQVTASGIVSLNPNLRLKGSSLVEAQSLDTIEHVGEGQRVGELTGRIAPEDNAMTFFLKEPSKGVLDLWAVHYGSGSVTDGWLTFWSTRCA